MEPVQLLLQVVVVVVVIALPVAEEVPEAAVVADYGAVAVVPDGPGMPASVEKLDVCQLKGEGPR